MTAPLDFSGKTRADLDTLLANAERVLSDPKRAAQHKQAQAMKEEAERARGALPAQPGRKAAGPGTATDAAVARLTALGAALAKEFDLSPPEGTRQPHKFTSSDGSPKVAGEQRNREVAANRYLSYKRGSRIVALGWHRRLDEDPQTGGGWYVGYAEKTPFGDDADGAELAFRELLAELAPAR